MGTVIVACKTIADELKMAIDETQCKYPVLWINSGLHMDPDLLRKRLQEELNHIDNVDQVLLAFGFCGNALLGITASNYRIIFPRVEDCISLLLGSCQRRKEISAKMGTYFITKGWLEYEQNIWEEYKSTVERFGKAKADRIYGALLKHYERLGVIKTDAYDLEEFVEQTKSIAKDLNLAHEIISGNNEYMKRLLTGPWDEAFVVIEPGQEVTLRHTYVEVQEEKHTLSTADAVMD